MKITTILLASLSITALLACSDTESPSKKSVSSTIDMGIANELAQQWLDSDPRHKVYFEGFANAGATLALFKRVPVDACYDLWMGRTETLPPESLKGAKDNCDIMAKKMALVARAYGYEVEDEIIFKSTLLRKLGKAQYIGPKMICTPGDYDEDLMPSWQGTVSYIIDARQQPPIPCGGKSPYEADRFFEEHGDAAYLHFEVKPGSLPLWPPSR